MNKGRKKISAKTLKINQIFGLHSHYRHGDLKEKILTGN
jgi:hypothetical protein